MANESEFKKLSGALYSPPSKDYFWDNLERISNITTNYHKIVSGWVSFIVRPSKSWSKSEESLNLDNSHEFWVRRGEKNHVLILSTKSELVDELITNLGFSWKNRTASVDVPALMLDLLKSPRITEFSIGSVVTRIDGHGGSMRTMIIYGNDLASASTFTEHIVPVSDPYRIMLRKKGGSEILSISDKGEVTVDIYTNSLKLNLREIDNAIREINRLGHLSWSVGNFND